MKRIERKAIDACKKYCFENLIKISNSNPNMEVTYRDDTMVIICYGDIFCGTPKLPCGRVEIRSGKLRNITDGSEYFSAYIKNELK